VGFDLLNLDLSSPVIKVMYEKGGRTVLNKILQEGLALTVLSAAPISTGPVVGGTSG
jgi:hypothetical protein